MTESVADPAPESGAPPALSGTAPSSAPPASISSASISSASIQSASISSAATPSPASPPAPEHASTAIDPADPADPAGEADEADPVALLISAAAAAPVKVTLPREFLRVLRTWPDWLYGMLASMGIGLATGAFLYWTPAGRVRDPLTLLVTTVLTAVADASLTNQLAAEPEWAIKVLSQGGDPARMLRVRNQVLYIFEVGFAFGAAALIVVLTGNHHWVKHNWPIIAELPLAPIAAGNLASVLFPCPFMRLRYRLQATTTWPRWGAYIGIPFALTSLGTVMVMAFPTWVQNQIKHSAAHMHHRPTWLTDENIWLVTWLIAVPILNLAVWALALKAADILARMRRHHLLALMEKHSRLQDGFDELTLWGAVRALPANLRRIPADVRTAALAEIEQVRAVGGHIDRGLEHALARQAAKIREKRALEALRAAEAGAAGEATA